MFVELCFKIAAPLAAVISMASSGGFFNKLLEGFWSLPNAIREIVWWIQNLSEVSIIVDDYNSLTAAAFNQKYGAGAINYVMEYLNEGLTYLQLVYINFMEHPITTILAAVITFLVFYLAARIARFVRQKGQGSVFTRFERRTGKRVFKDLEKEEQSDSTPTNNPWV